MDHRQRRNVFILRGTLLCLVCYSFSFLPSLQSFVLLFCFACCVCIQQAQQRLWQLWTIYEASLLKPLWNLKKENRVNGQIITLYALKCHWQRSYLFSPERDRQQENGWKHLKLLKQLRESVSWTKVIIQTGKLSAVDSETILTFIKLLYIMAKVFYFVFLQTVAP